MAFNKAKAMQEAERLVSLRKTGDAIKHYMHILDKDPADISILNTVGDLYIRENNKGEALKCFTRLAEAYTRDGFTVKAIAIYKKIVKLDPNTIDAVLKLAELYIHQGLNREAREQFSLAVEYFKKKGLSDRALETYGRILALDPENRVHRTRLAELAEQMGRKDEAASAYLEVAENAFRAGDQAATEAPLKKSLQLDPQSGPAQMLWARLAASRQDYAQVEKILEAQPSLRETAPGQQLLLEAHLAGQKVDLAEKLVGDIYRSNPQDFSPLASFTQLCLSHGRVDAALGALRDNADLVIEKEQAAPLMDLLRQIWSKNPDHIGTLELVLRVAEKTHDDAALPEVLGALGRAYEQSGDLEKAEGMYRRLANREPANEENQSLLKRILQLQGKETAGPMRAALEGIALEVPEAEAAPTVDVAQAAMVNEALENSDLFSRYGLVDKAVAELEKVLAVHPEQVDIHRRIFEVCQRTQPARAGKAAEALAQIYRKRGDLENAVKYDSMAAQGASSTPVDVVARDSAGPPAPPPSEAAAIELDLTEIFAAPKEQSQAPETVPQEAPIGKAPPGETLAPPAEAQEMDFSGDSAAPTAQAAPAEIPHPAQEPPAFDAEEARMEVEFYLSQGFVDEARGALQALEEKFPHEPEVVELRKLVENRGAAPAAAAAEAPAPAPIEVEPVGVETAAEANEVLVSPAEAVPPPPPPESVDDGAPPAQPQPAIPAPEQPPVVAAQPENRPMPRAGGGMLASLVGEFEPGLKKFIEPALAPAAPGAQPPPDTSAEEEVSPLSGLLDELGEASPAAALHDDPETHYNLGVAFREMGLLDEAIGEFQKVVKGAQKENCPPNFLQACSLLAVSFMDKGMPQIAAKWYMRALEAPGLGEEATLALQYDLGVAYELAGDSRNALEKFSEVYSQNIDYRDVAEKIRALQQKAR